jgi:hypothetical protein
MTADDEGSPGVPGDPIGPGEGVLYMAYGKYGEGIACHP